MWYNLLYYHTVEARGIRLVNKTKKIIVKVTPALHKAVKIKAAKKDKSISEIVREMLQRWLKDEEDEQARSFHDSKRN